MPKINSRMAETLLPQSERDRNMREVFDYLKDNPEEDFLYRSYGNMLVTGFRHSDGEIVVFDSIPVGEMSEFLGDPNRDWRNEL